MSRRPIGLASASEASSRALRTRGSVGVLRCLAFAARSPRRMRLPIPLLLLLPLACAAAGFTPADLRTEYLVNPSGLGVPRPRFSWTDRKSHTSELQSLRHLVCRPLLEKK